MITHVSDELGERLGPPEAERTFGGPVEVAREGAVYDRLTGADATPVAVRAPAADRAGLPTRLNPRADPRARPPTACGCCRTVRPCSTRSSTTATEPADGDIAVEGVVLSGPAGTTACAT